MKQALVIGASGFVGRQLLAQLGARGVGAYRSRPLPQGLAFDATRDTLSDLLRRAKGDFSHVFVPFGAIDMEGCARNPEATAAINVTAVQAVLAEALALGLTPIYVSTDYVFDGERGLWRENDEARPRMAYGAQKLAVESWLKEQAGPWLICRLSKVLSERDEPANMLAEWAGAIRDGRRLTLAHDQFFSPAGVNDLAGAMIALADAGCTGLFHVAGPERISRLELFKRLATTLEKRMDMNVAEAASSSLHDFPFLERRPLDTSLDTARLITSISPKFQSIDDLCAAVAVQVFGASPAP